MEIIKKTNDFVVVRNGRGAHMKLTNDERLELMLKLAKLDNVPNGNVDGRRGQCLTEIDSNLPTW